MTKYMPNGDLYKELCGVKCKPFSEAKAKEVIRQVAKGLKVLHDGNILHRDIKLNNILVNHHEPEQQYYIADMGSAQILPTKESTCKFRICTAGYTAPEMLFGKPYGLAYDIWGLGALIYVLLLAKMPFWHDDDDMRNKRVCFEPLNLEFASVGRAMSPEVKDLLHRMLTKSPGDRIDIDEVLEHPWLAAN